MPFRKSFEHSFHEAGIHSGLQDDDALDDQFPEMGC
jgi:hypothetical protein